MISTPQTNSQFSASDFVDRLLKEGSAIRCDETNSEFDRTQLPWYYDKEKFKRGQIFFYKHIFAMFFSKILGLVTILAVPDLAQILKFTKMSDKPLTAYRRYLSTIFHMVVWYDHDFTEDSKVWKSIQAVKTKHNSASKRACSAGIGSISQKNMALTQFGFMGYAICEAESCGIYNASKEEFEDFIHIWKVVGYMMGMDDRFNICRDSFEDTKAICQELVKRVFQPEVQQQHENYINLTNCLVTGMRCMMPVMNHKVFLYFINELLMKPIYLSSNNNNNNNNKKVKVKHYKLNVFERAYLWLLLWFFGMMKYNFFRVIFVYNMHMVFWLMHNFPFLAYHKFGKENSHVYIFHDN